MFRRLIAILPIIAASLLIAMPTAHADHHGMPTAHADHHGMKKDIVDVAAENGSFRTLVAAVQAGGLVDTLKSEVPFTVFAPTDEAFAKLPGDVLREIKVLIERRLASHDEVAREHLHNAVGANLEEFRRRRRAARGRARAEDEIALRLPRRARLLVRDHRGGLVLQRVPDVPCARAAERMALERGEAFSDARGASSAKAREQGNGRTEGGGRGSFSDSSLRARRSERRPAGGAIARRDATTHRSPRPGTCSSRWPARQSASSPSSSRRFALWERRTGGVSGGDDDARGGFGSGSRSCTPTAATRFSTARRRGMDVGGERAWAPLLVRDLHRAVLRRPARDGVCVMTRGGGGRGGQSESDFKQLLVGVPPRIGRARARRCRDRAR